MCACIVAGIALGVTSVADYRILWLIAALGAQLRLTANMLDGMVALASGRAKRRLGDRFDVFPDIPSRRATVLADALVWLLTHIAGR